MVISSVCLAQGQLHIWLCVHAREKGYLCSLWAISKSHWVTGKPSSSKPERLPALSCWNSVSDVTKTLIPSDTRQNIMSRRPRAGNMHQDVYELVFYERYVHSCTCVHVCFVYILHVFPCVSLLACICSFANVYIYLCGYVCIRVHCVLFQQY